MAMFALAAASTVSEPFSGLPKKLNALRMVAALPQANSPATGLAGPRAIFSYSSSVIGRSASQSSIAATVGQLKYPMARSGRVVLTTPPEQAEDSLIVFLFI